MHLLDYMYFSMFGCRVTVDRVVHQREIEMLSYINETGNPQGQAIFSMCMLSNLPIVCMNLILIHTKCAAFEPAEIVKAWFAPR